MWAREVTTPGRTHIAPVTTVSDVPVVGVGCRSSGPGGGGVWLTSGQTDRETKSFWTETLAEVGASTHPGDSSGHQS